MADPGAERRPLSGTELKRLHRARRREATGRVALLLDGVQGPFNVGSIVRTAAAFRVEHLHVAGPTDPTHPQARKTALGTERHLPWTRHGSISDALEEIASEGFALVGIELVEGAAPIDELELPEDVCLAVGHEERGLSRTCLAACSQVGYVPLLGRVGSLNVAVAAAIALYDVRRRG